MCRRISLTETENFESLVQFGAVHSLEIQDL